MNREAVGPPILRNEQLLALIESGIVEIAIGASPSVVPNQKGFMISSTSFVKNKKENSLEQEEYQADVLVKARIDHFDLSHSSSLLMKHLLSNHLCAPFKNGPTYSPGGLNISKNHCLIDGNGIEHPTFFVSGNPAEGPNWYTYVLPRPYVHLCSTHMSRSLTDAAHDVKEGLKAAIGIIKYE